MRCDRTTPKNSPHGPRPNFSSATRERAPDSGAGIDGVAESLEREETGTQLDLTFRHVAPTMVVVLPQSTLFATNERFATSGPKPGKSARNRGANDHLALAGDQGVTGRQPALARHTEVD
jgi:hypothetical protein